LKRFLVLSFTQALVLGLTLVASAAELKLSGDARVRGIWQKNYDYDENIKADEDWYDYRLRLNVTGKVRDIEARSRITLLEGKSSEKMYDVKADYAYLHVPLGPITLDVGRQDSNWGNKFEIWDDIVDRLMISSKVRDIKLGIFADTAVEIDVPGDDSLKDKEGYGGFVEGNFGGINTGVIMIQGVDSRKKLKDMTDSDYQCAGELAAYYAADAAYDAALAAYLLNKNTTTEDALDLAKDIALYTRDTHADCRDDYAKASSRTAADVYVKGMAGPVDVSMEIVLKTGGLNNVDEDKSPMGFLMSGSMPMDALTLDLELAYTSNGFVADDEYIPTLFFGTDQPTASMNFGECATSALSKYEAYSAKGDIDGDGEADPCSALIGVLGIDYKITQAVSVDAKVAYAKWFDYSVEDAWGTEFKSKDLDGWTKSVLEVDAGFKYDILKNVSYNLDIGCLIPRMNNSDQVAGTPESDVAIAIAHGLSVKF
jgi:hypothetical protein